MILAKDSNLKTEVCDLCGERCADPQRLELGEKDCLPLIESGFQLPAWLGTAKNSRFVFNLHSECLHKLKADRRLLFDLLKNHKGWEVKDRKSKKQ